MTGNAGNPVASLLRRAAAGMREKAADTTPGPWAFTGADVVSRVADRHWAGACAANAVGGDGGHIASWHPLVAVAVAGWLETEALRAEAGLAPHRKHRGCGHSGDGGWCCDRCGDVLGENCACWDKAMAVARAWLGETGTGDGQ